MSLSLKIQVLALLSDASLSPQQLFNSCLSLLSSLPGNNAALRHFNRSGFSVQRLESIKYDLKKAAGVSEMEISSYEAAQKNIHKGMDTAGGLTETGKVIDLNTNAGDNTNGLSEGFKDLDVRSVKKEIENASLEAKTGYSLRAEFPFLYEDNCPDEFKILVADKITAYTKFLEDHKELSDLIYGTIDKKPVELTNEDLYVLGANVIKNFKENEDIYQELVYYRDNKEVLGKHPKLQDLARQQEVDAMNKAALEKNLKNFKQYNSRDDKKIKKAKTEDSRLKIEAKIREREEQMTLMQSRLDLLNTPITSQKLNGAKEEE